jgi:4-hydroxy-tetrahydrodipicolinate synthase
MLKVLAAITTPFGADGAIDLDAFEAHVRWLEEERLDGLFVAGTTGEGVLLEPEEVEALAARAVEARGSLRVIVQVGRPSTRATVALARRALAAGADGVAAYVPWFYPVTGEQLRSHFLALLEAADGAPAFLYNIPPRTVNDLSPSLAGELARAGFAGMKDSTGDFARHEAYLEAVGGVDSFELFTGTEPQIAAAARAGGTGSINGLANCRPELFVALREALEAGDGVEPLHDEIAELKAQVRTEESTVIAVKRRVRERLAARGVDYPAAARAPFS